jgi:hypothetical protein
MSTNACAIGRTPPACRATEKVAGSPGGLGAILILETESLEDADRHLASLPLLTNQIMSLELTELHPFSALQMLFRTETVQRAHPTSARGSELAS